MQRPGVIGSPDLYDRPEQAGLMSPVASSPEPDRAEVLPLGAGGRAVRGRAQPAAVCLVVTPRHGGVALEDEVVSSSSGQTPILSLSG